MKFFISLESQWLLFAKQVLEATRRLIKRLLTVSRQETMVVQMLLMATYITFCAGYIVKVESKYYLDVECERNRGFKKDSNIYETKALSGTETGILR